MPPDSGRSQLASRKRGLVHKVNNVDGRRHVLSLFVASEGQSLKLHLDRGHPRTLNFLGMNIRS